MPPTAIPGVPPHTPQNPRFWPTPDFGQNSGILSRLGELLNTQKNVHFLSPRGAPRVGGGGVPPYPPFHIIIVLLLTPKPPILGVPGGGPGGAPGGPPGGPPGRGPRAPARARPGRGAPGGPPGTPLPGGSFWGYPDNPFIAMVNGTSCNALELTHCVVDCINDCIVIQRCIDDRQSLR